MTLNIKYTNGEKRTFKINNINLSEDIVWFTKENESDEKFVPLDQILKFSVDN